MNYSNSYFTCMLYTFFVIENKVSTSLVIGQVHIYYCIINFDIIVCIIHLRIN